MDGCVVYPNDTFKFLERREREIDTVSEREEGCCLVIYEFHQSKSSGGG
jgi:hypothetical protein